jgi:phospholipid/cholesterol/gamma-HCH transport system permease protein
MFAPAEKLNRSFLSRLVWALGASVWAHWDGVRHATAVVTTALISTIRPSCWPRAIRKLFARQLFSMAMEPLGFVCGVAVFVGVSVVTQLSSWVQEVGQSQLLGPALVTVVARDLGPILINLIVIVRSGSAMTTELGVLKLNGEVGALEAHGQDAFLNLVMPRVLGMGLSTFCLTIVFIVVALGSGFSFAAAMGKGSGDLSLFADVISRSVHPREVFTILGKSILPALFAAACCCIGGLEVGATVEEIPQATQRALTRSVAGLFVISAVSSLLTYLTN